MKKLRQGGFYIKSTKCVYFGYSDQFFRLTVVVIDLVKHAQRTNISLLNLFSNVIKIIIYLLEKSNIERNVLSFKSDFIQRSYLLQGLLFWVLRALQKFENIFCSFQARRLDAQSMPEFFDSRLQRLLALLTAGARVLAVVFAAKNDEKISIKFCYETIRSYS